MSNYRAIGAVALLLVASVTGVTFAASQPAAADQHTTVLGEVLDGPDDNESTTEWTVDGLSVAWAAAGGAQDRAVWAISQNAPDFVAERFGAQDQLASAEAESVTTYWNEHNQTLMTWSNDRGTFSENRTIEMTWHLNGETATRYVLVNVSDGNVTRAHMVESTSRSVTDSTDLCRFAAEQSQEELQTFVTDYAEPNKDVDTAYLARLKGKYGDDVSTTLYPSSGDCGSAS